MSIRRLLLSALAVAVSVNAADSCSDDVTISSDSDVSSFSSCTTISGDLKIGSKVTTLELQMTQVEGDVVIDGASSLTSISFPKLQSIKGAFTLTGLTVLSSLSAPNLVSCGSIDWTTLPALESLQFTKEVTTADKLTISDTALKSLDGINLVTCDEFDINNNKYLKSVDVGLHNVSNILTIAFNGKEVTCSFPNLQWANNVTVRDAGGISFPSLESVNNSMSFVNNTFENAMFPNLTEVGQSLAFVSCTKLTNVSAPELTKVGGTFQLANNTKLEVVDGFEKLATVGGAVDMSGTFTNVSLPSLESVRGGFNLQSTEALDDSDCDTFKSLKSSGAIQGDEYTCKSKLSKATSSEGGASTSGDGSSDDDDSTKKSAASRVGASFALAALSVGAVALAL